MCDTFQYPILSLIFLTLLCWYQGILTAFFLSNTEFLCIIFPFPVIIMFIYFLIGIYRTLVILVSCSRKGFYTNYYHRHLKGGFFFKNILDITTPPHTYIVWLFQLNNLVVKYKPEVLWFLLTNPNWIPSLVNSWFVALHTIYSLLTKDTWQFISEYPENFLRKAMFCNTVTFWLFVFYYRLFMGFEIQPKKINNQTLHNFWLFIQSKLTQVYTTHRVSPKTRQSLWFSLNEDFYRSFFFVKRFKRINDLIWQDGFLIDFLQKKVIDKWIRGFIIYSANLFSERLLFDRVVRFYIDFIFKSISNITIYEFNSASSVMLINLQLLIISFLIVFFFFCRNVTTLIINLQLFCLSTW